MDELDTQMQKILGFKPKQFSDTSETSLLDNQMNSILKSSKPTVTPVKNNSWDSFKTTAKQMAKDNNYPVNVLLGQAAIETGRGTSSFAKQRNNYFGYQAYDSNPDAAKSYSSMENSIQDYIDLIKNSPRYKFAYQTYLIDHDPVKLIQGIKYGGYATDPNYVKKVMSTKEFQE